MTIEEFDNLDILGWWKERESQFLVLAAMTRDLLSVQASTVASESAFSVRGRVISPQRTKLTPVSVEVCISLKDHLDSMERIQHVSPLEGELERVEEEIHVKEIAMGQKESGNDFECTHNNDKSLSEIQLEHCGLWEGGVEDWGLTLGGSEDFQEKFRGGFEEYIDDEGEEDKEDEEGDGEV
ncbi:zinc finger BED domain-containing protein RICESLEEPER 2 [Tanacetum coccineum]